MGTTVDTTNQQRRPGPDSRLKMHLRLLSLGGTTYHVVTLRPSADVTFSTNFFHETWHILSDLGGAKLLGRLLWGLSFQNRPNTILLIHGSHLVPTPFEAERPDPFLFAVAGLTRLDPRALRVLKNRLKRLCPPACTVRWHPHGLDFAQAAGGDGRGEAEALRRLRGSTARRAGICGTRSVWRGGAGSSVTRPLRR
jgi:hypothetical protein